MGRYMDGWMDGYVDRWIDRQTDVFMYFNLLYVNDSLIANIIYRKNALLFLS